MLATVMAVTLAGVMAVTLATVMAVMAAATQCKQLPNVTSVYT